MLAYTVSRILNTNLLCVLGGGVVGGGKGGGNGGRAGTGRKGLSMTFSSSRVRVLRRSKNKSHFLLLAKGNAPKSPVSAGW